MIAYEAGRTSDQVGHLLRFEHSSRSRERRRSIRLFQSLSRPRKEAPAISIFVGLAQHGAIKPDSARRRPWMRSHIQERELIVSRGVV
jgi:hypothetical protein